MSVVIEKINLSPLFDCPLCLINGAAKPGRAISDPKEIAQIVMMQIDHVNVKKDELTIAVKALADTTKKLFSAYANQQAQLAKLAKQVEELQKAKGQ